MAADWIPMRIDLIDDPAVIAIAARLDLDEYAVVGRLHRLWAWANSHLLDGHARSVTPQQVDRLISTPNFATALQEAGWLQVRSDGVAFPNFDRWNSQSAKKRILSAKRQQKSRHGNEPKVSRSERDESVTREEKRREEKKKDPPNPPSGGIVPNPSPLVPVAEKAKKPRQHSEPSSEHPIAIRIFTDAWGEKYGAKYPFDGSKHGKAFAWMLDQAGGKAENLRPIVARFLADQDDFYAAGSRHSIDKLRANFARWVTDATPTKQPTAFKSKRDADAEYLASQIFEVMNPTGA